MWCQFHNQANCPCPQSQLALSAEMDSAKWSEPKELFSGVFEKTKYNPTTGRFENIIYKEGSSHHFHGWLDSERNQAGGEINKND